jgi:hypothetical protein
MSLLAVAASEHTPGGMSKRKDSGSTNVSLTSVRPLWLKVDETTPENR